MSAVDAACCYIRWCGNVLLTITVCLLVPPHKNETLYCVIVWSYDVVFDEVTCDVEPHMLFIVGMQQRMFSLVIIVSLDEWF